MDVEAQGTGDVIDDLVDAEIAKNADANADMEDEDEVETKETEVENQGENADDDGGEVDKEMKTIKKALSKKNRYIDNLRSRNRALEQQIQKLRETKPELGEAPKMEGFESVLDYVRAQNQHDLKTELSNQRSEMQIAALEQQKAALKIEQEERIGQETAELVSTNADAKAVLQKNLAVIQSMPKHIEELLYEVDSPSVAAYALAKEGRLEQVYNMSPQIAVAELVAAQFRGQQYLAQGQKQAVSKAPKPMEASKGTGKVGSTISSKTSPEKILKWLDS